MTWFDTFLDRNWARLWQTFFAIKRRLGFLHAPDDVQWLATGRCNLSCRHCGSDAGAVVPQELTTAEMRAVIDDLALLRVQYLTLTGGEPLLRDDLFELLGYAATKGIRYNLVTNSTFVPRFAEHLTRLPPAAIKVSIDGVPATHAAIRGDPDNFRACLAALTFFKQLGIDTRVICTTLNQQNLPELAELFKYVLSSDASFWEFHLPIFEGRAVTNKSWSHIRKDQVEQVFRFVLDHQALFPIFLGEGCGHCGHLTRHLYLGRRFFCGSGWTTFTIMPNGDIAGCPAFKPEWTESNVRHESVLSAWQHRFTRFREVHRHLDQECRDCPHLAACNGGCWLHRRTGDHCYRDIWEKMSVARPPQPGLVDATTGASSTAVSTSSAATARPPDQNTLAITHQPENIAGSTTASKPGS